MNKVLWMRASGKMHPLRPYYFKFPKGRIILSPLKARLFWVLLELDYSKSLEDLLRLEFYES